MLRQKNYYMINKKHETKGVVEFSFTRVQLSLQLGLVKRQQTVQLQAGAFSRRGANLLHRILTSGLLLVAARQLLELMDGAINSGVGGSQGSR
jgi:hypothetical protein